MSRTQFLIILALSGAIFCAMSGIVLAQEPPSQLTKELGSLKLHKLMKNGKIEEFELDPALANAIKPNPNDSPLRKLQKERCTEKLVYLAKLTTLIAIGKWNPQDFNDYMKSSASLAENLMELMVEPGDKLKCLELRVDLLKTLERFVELRVNVGSDPSQLLNLARSDRLDAEIQLLKLKEGIEKYAPTQGQTWPDAWFYQPPFVFTASLRGAADASYYANVYYYPNGGIYPPGYNPTIYPGSGVIPAPGLIDSKTTLTSPRKLPTTGKP